MKFAWNVQNLSNLFLIRYVLESIFFYYDSFTALKSTSNLFVCIYIHSERKQLLYSEAFNKFRCSHRLQVFYIWIFFPLLLPGRERKQIHRVYVEGALLIGWVISHFDFDTSWEYVLVIQFIWLRRSNLYDKQTSNSSFWRVNKEEWVAFNQCYQPGNSTRGGRFIPVMTLIHHNRQVV